MIAKSLQLQATFSALETIKSKHRCFLSDESLESLLICAVSEIEPRLYKLLNHLNSELQISELI